MKQKIINAYTWVSVDEELPPIGEEVIVFVVATGRVTALTRKIRHMGATDFYWDNDYGRGNEHISTAISHWQKMPRKP